MMGVGSVWLAGDGLGVLLGEGWEGGEVVEREGGVVGVIGGGREGGHWEKGRMEGK